MTTKPIPRNPHFEAVYASILAKAATYNGKIRYAVLEELCDTYDEMANFYSYIKAYGITVVGEFPPRVKKALAEYGINVDQDRKKGAI